MQEFFKKFEDYCKTPGVDSGKARIYQCQGIRRYHRLGIRDRKIKKVNQPVTATDL